MSELILQVSNTAFKISISLCFSPTSLANLAINSRLYLKDLLGQAVVRALKKNRLSCSHPSFKACYTQSAG